MKWGVLHGKDEGFDYKFLMINYRADCRKSRRISDKIPGRKWVVLFNN